MDVRKGTKLIENGMKKAIIEFVFFKVTYLNLIL